MGAIVAAPFAVIGAPFDALTDSRAVASQPNVVPRAAAAQVPEVGDPSCHLEIYNSFGVVPGRVHRYTTMCGPQWGLLNERLGAAFDDGADPAGLFCRSDKGSAAIMTFIM
jgi:hypothetical protein